MFDGNFRTRRNINLGTSGNKSRRRRMNKSSSSSNTSTNNNSILLGSSSSRNSIESTVSATSNVPNSRQHLLQQSERLRKERWAQQTRNSSAVCIQRHFRSYRCRKRIATEYLVGLMGQVVDKCSKGGSIFTAQDLERLCSIVTLRLSHPLRSFLKSSNINSNYTINDGIGQIVEELGSVLESIDISSILSNNNNNSGNLLFSSRPTRKVMYSPIIYHTLTLLHKHTCTIPNIIPPPPTLVTPSSTLTTTVAAAVASTTQKTEQSIRHLLKILEFLLNQDDLLWEDLWMSTTQYSTTLDMKTSSSTVMNIFVKCCTDWFWKCNSSTIKSATIHTCICKDLLKYLFRAMRVASTYFDKNDDRISTITSLLGVIVLSSGTDLQQLQTSWGSELVQGLDYVTNDTKTNSVTVGAKMDQWYERLLQSVVKVMLIDPSTSTREPSATKTMGEVTPMDIESSSFPSLTKYSINSTNSTITTNPNSTESKTLTIIQILSKTVKDIMHGREIIFLTNALDIFSNSVGDGKHASTENDISLCITIIHVLNSIFFSTMNNGISATGTNNIGTTVDHESESAALILNVISCLAARWHDVESYLDSLDNFTSKPSSIQNESDGGQLDNDDEEDDDDDDDMMEIMFAGNEGSQQAASARRKGGMRTRQDYLTLSKLDSLYQSKMAELRNDVLKLLTVRKKAGGGGSSSQMLHDTSFLCNVAKRLGGGELMFKLGSILFDFQTLSATRCRNGVAAGDDKLMNNNEESASLTSAREAYFKVLSNLLQFCSGSNSKDSARSPLLLKLGFQSVLLEELWSQAQIELRTFHPDHSKKIGTKRSLDATISFCDLFVQHLLAMDDNEFLATYTAHTDHNTLSSTRKSKIQAVDIIQSLKGILHELYWSKPVIASDYIAPSRVIFSVSTHTETYERSEKARLLLSGTKLWNSLYERWSRLYHSTKICDEEYWWFPRLVTRENDMDGAMGQSQSSLADVPMDVDSDDEDMIPQEQQPQSAIATEQQMESENEGLAASFRDAKIARVLTSIPQCLPFDRRAKLFSSLLSADIRSRAREEAQEAQAAVRRQLETGNFDDSFLNEQGVVKKVQVKRDTLYRDSMDQLNTLGKQLRRRIQVSFISQHGTEEAGIDGGGVFKEFLDDLLKDAFHPNGIKGFTMPPLFVISELQTLSVNTNVTLSKLTFSHYEFLGRILGKAVYESILVEPQFCLPFLNQLLGKQNTLDDLKNVDPELYKNLNELRKMPKEALAQLGLTFEITTPSPDGQSSTTSVNLIPGGSSIPVTKDNAIRYIHLVAHRRLNIESYPQTQAFLRGFRDLIPAAWVRLFSPYELQKVISGDDSVKGVDIDGLKSTMQYSGGFHPSQDIIKWFWEVLSEMSFDHQRKFLKFMTSCSRQPLLGFQALAPRPCIQQIRLSTRGDRNEDGEESSHSNGDVRLPTSSTCMNLLKLPCYESKEQLQEKLLYAIESGAGFELS